MNIVFLSSSAPAQAKLEAELALFNMFRESLFGSLYEPECNQTSKLGLLGIQQLVSK